LIDFSAQISEFQHQLFIPAMKIFTFISALLLALTVSGCHSHSQPKPPAVKPQPIVMPDLSLTAKVVSVNLVGRFVILSFPAGGMPNVDQTMFLYRSGLKVAEVRVTGPQQETNIAADIVSGDAQVGDDVSEK
jgi:hypothetical protein